MFLRELGHVLSTIGSRFCCSLLSSAPAAAIIYQYTGQTFTDFSATEFTPQPHDETMRITAQIVLSSPLEAGATIDVLRYSYDPVGNWSCSSIPDFVSAQFSNGVNAFSLA